MPSDVHIANSFRSNNDGAGYMYTYNGKVHIRKGFMELGALMDSLDKTRKEVGSLTRLPVVLHFRIATAGAISQFNCHPFPLSNNPDWLCKTELWWDCAVVHNGCLFGYKTKWRSGPSDTYLFVMTKLCNYRIRRLQNKNVQSQVFGNSWDRFALLDRAGRILKVGQFYDDNGLSWSNTGYRWGGHSQRWDCYSQEKEDVHLLTDEMWRSYMGKHFM